MSEINKPGYALRFEGGTWDGKTKYVEKLSRYYMVAKRLPDPPGTIEDFLKIDLDVVYGNKARPMAMVVQKYRIDRRVDAETGDRFYVAVYESEGP